MCQAADQVGSSANLLKNQFRGSSQSADKTLNDTYKEIDRMCERMSLQGIRVERKKEKKCGQSTE